MQAKRRIGLLGGSFNPAHAGHRHISLEALKRLQLDEIWWLVSPQNPLKAHTDMAGYSTRLAKATLVARHPRIRVLDIEAKQALRFTTDTIDYLQRIYVGTRFIWLMGADNLSSFHRWRAWQSIAARIPIAVLDRAPYGLKALHRTFALRYRQQRLPERNAASLADVVAPAWTYLTIPRHPLSATELRNSLGTNAFLSHTYP